MGNFGLIFNLSLADAGSAKGMDIYDFVEIVILRYDH